jgi:hypothetical protein
VRKSIFRIFATKAWQKSQRHNEPSEPTKKGPISFVLLVSPFTSNSTVSRCHPSLVSLVNSHRREGKRYSSSAFRLGGEHLGEMLPHAKSVFGLARMLSVHHVTIPMRKGTIREYWMIYRGPGFLLERIIQFLAHPLSSPLFCHKLVSLTQSSCARRCTIRPRGRLVLNFYHSIFSRGNF